MYISVYAGFPTDESFHKLKIKKLYSYWARKFDIVIDICLEVWMLDVCVSVCVCVCVCMCVCVCVFVRVSGCLCVMKYS